MRKPRARARRRRIDAYVERRRDGPIANDGAGLVAESEIEPAKVEMLGLRLDHFAERVAFCDGLFAVAIDSEIHDCHVVAHDNGRIDGRQRRYAEHHVDLHHAHRVAHALVAVDLRYRAPLDFVAVEQSFAGVAAYDGSNLPRKIVGVLDAGVHAETARRWKPMRGIAGEEHAPAAITVGNLC